jgi:hypothetical protein
MGKKQSLIYVMLSNLMKFWKDQNYAHMSCIADLPKIELHYVKWCIASLYYKLIISYSPLLFTTS